MRCTSENKLLPNEQIHISSFELFSHFGYAQDLHSLWPWPSFPGSLLLDIYYYISRYHLQTSLDNIRDSFLLRNSQLLDTVLEQANQKALGKLISGLSFINCIVAIPQFLRLLDHMNIRHPVQMWGPTPKSDISQKLNKEMAVQVEPTEKLAMTLTWCVVFKHFICWEIHTFIPYDRLGLGWKLKMSK